jgi:hypothetical protein
MEVLREKLVQLSSEVDNWKVCNAYIDKAYPDITDVGRFALMVEWLSEKNALAGKLYAECVELEPSEEATNLRGWAVSALQACWLLRNHLD